MNAHAFDDWVAEARAVPLVDYARQRAPALKRNGRDMVGPCPACGGTDRFSISLTKNLWFCRKFEGGAGGDVIALARHVEGVDFIGACEALTGRPPPGRDSTDTPEARAAREAAARARHAAAEEAAARRAKADAAHTAKERQRARRIWEEAALTIAGTPAEAYLNLRGLTAPEGAHLRYAAEHPLWGYERLASGRLVPVVVHAGPALIAGIIGADGRFAGVHATWIDLADPDGKARIIEPETGRPLPSKKIRGTVHGARIELVRVPEPEALFIGEGTETALSAFQALERRLSPLVRNAALWSGVSLGNMAGRALDREPHPTLREIGPDGEERPKGIAGTQPDPADAILPIPPSVRRLTWLGDGDSDRFTTELALRRAANRHARPGLEQFIAWAEPGQDFNSMLRGAA